MVKPLKEQVLSFVASNITLVVKVDTLETLPEELQTALLCAVLRARTFSQHAAKLFIRCWPSDNDFERNICAASPWDGPSLEALGFVLFNEQGWDVMRISEVSCRIANSPRNYPSCSNRTIDFGAEPEQNGFHE